MRRREGHVLCFLFGSRLKSDPIESNQLVLPIATFLRQSRHLFVIVPITIRELYAYVGLFSITSKEPPFERSATKGPSLLLSSRVAPVFEYERQSRYEYLGYRANWNTEEA